MMKKAVGFIMLNWRALMRWCVSLLSQQFTDTTSDSRISVSKSTIFTPRSLTADCGTLGSHPRNFMSHGLAMRNTSLPMLPTPITPKVLPLKP